MLFEEVLLEAKLGVPSYLPSVPIRLNSISFLFLISPPVVFGVLSGLQSLNSIIEVVDAVEGRIIASFEWIVHLWRATN